MKTEKFQVKDGCTQLMSWSFWHVRYMPCNRNHDDSIEIPSNTPSNSSLKWDSCSWFNLPCCSSATHCLQLESWTTFCSLAWRWWCCILFLSTAVMQKSKSVNLVSAKSNTSLILLYFQPLFTFFWHWGECLMSLLHEFDWKNIFY